MSVVCPCWSPVDRLHAVLLPSSPRPKTGDNLSPAAATTAEEAMSVSHDTRPSAREIRVLPGDLGATGGAAPLGGGMASARAEGGREETPGESEAWAAAVPPVSAHLLFSGFLVCPGGSRRFC